MTITFESIAQEARQCAVDLYDGVCFRNFDNMTSEKQIETIIKVSLLASLAGIIAGNLFGGGFTFTAVVAIGAFSYYTNSNQCTLVATAIDAVNQGIKNFKDALK